MWLAAGATLEDDTVMTTELVQLELPSDVVEVAEQMAAKQGVCLHEWIARGIELLIAANALIDLREDKKMRSRPKKLSEAQLRRERLRAAKIEFTRSNPQTRQ
jgi:hypothetical protein